MARSTAVSSPWLTAAISRSVSIINRSPTLTLHGLFQGRANDLLAGEPFTLHTADEAARLLRLVTKRHQCAQGIALFITRSKRHGCSHRHRQHAIALQIIEAITHLHDQTL